MPHMPVQAYGTVTVDVGTLNPDAPDDQQKLVYRVHVDGYGYTDDNEEARKAAKAVLRSVLHSLEVEDAE